LRYNRPIKLLSNAAEQLVDQNIKLWRHYE